MTPERARLNTKRRIQNYLELHDTNRALDYMRQEASELLFWILQLQRGQKFHVVQGGKNERSSVTIGPCVVRATGDI